MKVGKRLTAFFLAGMLILTSNVTGFAEETTADQQPEEAKSTYLLTVDAEDSTVTVKGDHVEQKTASTYQIEAGSEVAASITPADGKEIRKSVSIRSRWILPMEPLPFPCRKKTACCR